MKINQSEKADKFSMTVSLEMEIALASLPTEEIDLWARQGGRHQCLKVALLEGICALAKAFEQGKIGDVSQLRFDVVPSEAGGHYREFCKRANLVEEILAEALAD